MLGVTKFEQLYSQAERSQCVWGKGVGEMPKFSTVVQGTFRYVCTFCQSLARGAY